MFDLAWSEIALIAVVALVVIGPKDLPEAVRGAARGIQKLRRMIGEFQSQADELVREAKLDDVRNQIHEVRSAVSDFRNFDLKGEVEKNVDPDGTLRRGFADPASGGGWSAPDAPAADAPAADVQASPAVAEAPAFIPPGTMASPAATVPLSASAVPPPAAMDPYATAPAAGASPTPSTTPAAASPSPTAPTPVATAAPSLPATNSPTQA